MTNPSVDDEPLHLAFTGSATIVSGHDAHTRLLQALETGRDVAVDCSGITETDLSFVQLLLAARRSAQARRQRLVLSSPAGGALLKILVCAGLTGAASHGPDTDEAFWEGKTA